MQLSGLGLLLLSPVCHAEIEFNIDALDLEDRTRIDLSHFKEESYVLPGDYYLEIEVNQHKLPLQKVPYYVRNGEEGSGVACLSRETVALMALTDEALAGVGSWHHDQCADLQALDGVIITNQIGSGWLKITIPQVWMKYQDPDWTPPEQWQHGIAGAMLDYNLTGYANRSQTSGTTTGSLSSYGTLGLNYEAWRLRGDYQANSYWGDNSRSNGQINRVYGYRPLPTLAARLTLGEQYLASQFIDGFRYTGLNVQNDERMLPPSLQGYAPEVSGIAKTNAKVTVLQAGRVIYEANVAAGPFRLRDLDSAVTGRLDVTVEEQDGSVSTFQIDTANIPYLTRPGHLRYNVSTGVPAKEAGSNAHEVQGPAFVAGDFSWGAANAWSLFGGSLIALEYNSWGVGIGRDLFAFGALSADVTQSIASLPDQPTQVGHSFRLNYAKTFDEYHSAITFAGYRFSQESFMTLPQFLSAKERLTQRESGAAGNERYSWNDKELYTISANKDFWADDPAKAMTMSLDYTHRTYWNHESDNRYGISLNKLANIGSLRDISLFVSAYKTQNDRYTNERSVALSLSMPIGDRKSAGYNVQSSNGQVTHLATYHDYSGQQDSYQLGAGVQSNGHSVVRGYYTHNGPLSELNLSGYAVQNEYVSVGAGLRGGLTVTEYGAALHPATHSGSTRMLVDTDDVAGVSFNHGQSRTNRFGLGVIGDVNAYRKNDTRVDVDDLDDEIDAINAIRQSTLTEGAIGYSRFEMAQGVKLLATIELADGSNPPFGTAVTDELGRTVAVVDEDGLAYLSGVKEGTRFRLGWDKGGQCTLQAPAGLTNLSHTIFRCQ